MMSLPRFHIRSLMIATAIAGIVLAAAVLLRNSGGIGNAFVLLIAPSVWTGHRLTEELHKSDRSKNWEERLAYAITLFLTSIASVILAMLAGLFIISWVFE